MKLQLLDCTLRDGGYVNDWKFGQGNLVSVFERLVDAKVDIIEIGFLDDRRPFDIDRSIMPTTKCADQIYGGLDKKGSMVVGMIDYGTCAIENLSRCEDSCLDGIRVIFKKHLMHEAMDFCRQVKALGYKVFSQLVSITSYNDEELLELVGLVNDVKPFAVSMVDTYGLLHPEDLLHYYQILDDNVIPEVQIGFHAHNNFQLAYANALAFIGKETKHDIVVDGTLYGMGKSAGNAPIELLAMRMNDKFGKHYNIDSLLEAIEETVKGFYAKSPWGYKTFFYLCSKNECHPNYVKQFEGKENLSVTKLDELLSTIEPTDKKLLYDKQLGDSMYEQYVEDTINSKQGEENFKKEITGKKLLILGPGKNMHLQADKVARYVEQNSPYIVSINYIPNDVDVNCVFTTNRKRYHDMTLDLKKKEPQILATSNIECRNGEFDFVINRAPLLEDDEKIKDNSFLMLVRFLVGIGIKDIACAGFDGYSEQEDNYCNPGMEYSYIKENAVYLNRHMKEKIQEFRNSMDIRFITYSAYDVVEDISSAAI